MYPYKNAGYWLWIYNEIEIARDKSMFIFNFLREQYHAGIGKMEWIPDEETESTITEKDLKVIIPDLKMARYEAIAQAEPITTEQHENIKMRLNDEAVVSDVERNSLKRKNLLDFYDLGERHINSLFVKSFGDKTIKKAYRNRETLKPGIETACENESRTFNGLFMDMTNVQDDLKRDYVAVKLVIATELVKICGFNNVYDTDIRTKQQIEKGLTRHRKVIQNKIENICDVLDCSVIPTPQNPPSISAHRMQPDLCVCV